MLQQLKNIYHFLQAHMWRAVFGFPDRGISIVGITGTNGKTTTCYIMAGILSAEVGEKKVGMLTTVGLRVGDTTTMNATKLTTLPSKLVYSYLKQMKEAGVTHCVIELTSHALDQHRVAGLRLAGGIILNISAEHMNYHHTVSGIAEAKARIVKYLKKGAPLVGKKDNVHVNQILNMARSQGVSVIDFTSEEAKVIDTPLAGDVNKENVLAARLLAKALHVSEAAIDAGVQAVDSVPGRMEWVKAGQPFNILIDYAVTPDALRKLYIYVRAKTQGKVFAVIGAAGLRDRDKRKHMLHIISEFADEIVVTREDPWTENEEQIFTDLEEGLKDTSVPWQRIVDRADALAYALEKAKLGDTVVATGKGAETGMGIGKNIVPYNERETIEDILKERYDKTASGDKLH